jgi:hypothetical protein
VVVLGELVDEPGPAGNLVVAFVAGNVAEQVDPGADAAKGPAGSEQDL